MLVAFFLTSLITSFWVSIFMASAIHNSETYILLTTEGQNLEFLTAIFYLLAGIFLILTTVKTYRSRGKLPILFLLLGLFFIFIAGEEESWGQWMFDYEISDHIKAVSTQDELNIHNLEVFSGILHPHFILNLFVLVYAVLIPWISYLSIAVRDFLSSLDFPTIPVWLTSWFIGALIYEKLAYNIIPATEVELWRHTEITEFLFSAGFCFFASFLLFDYSKLQRSSSH